MNQTTKKNRREFLRMTRNALFTTMAAPMIVPRSVLGGEGAVAPSDRIAMGFIGLGNMGNGHIFGESWTYLPGGYLARSDVQILAVSDVWKEKQEKTRDKINLFYSRKYGQGKFPSCEVYSDFRQLLARNDIDAVLIATPIHWHSTMTVLAAQAGKDVYCEKPTSVTLHEAKAMAKAIADNKRIFQAGTQQRSEYEGRFYKVCELVRNERIGKLKEVYAFSDGGGAQWLKETGKELPIPEGFDWDLWLGPAPKIPFDGRADAHLFGTGGINWGQHHYDFVQWVLDADRTGPVELFIDNEHAAYRYANGVVVYGRPYPNEKIGETGGGWFVGTKGKIGVDREHLVADPPEILEQPIGENDVQVYHSESHSGNFLDCIKTRKPTICDAETAHRASSVLLLGGIVMQLKRKLIWDPQSESFTNDEEANALRNWPMREPWVI